MSHITANESSSPSARTDAKPLRVLLVDDNPVTVKLAEYSFNQAGWEVRAHNSPLTALKDLSNFEPDLIITDFRMPELNGPEFLLAAEQIHPTVPKLVMTAFDDDPIIQATLRKAGIPSVSKLKGLAEVVSIATGLTAVRRSVKCKSASSQG